MYADIIRQRLSDYQASNEIQEENALKEILQEVVLAALFEVGFFRQAAFHGGTALRIFHGLNRFSEDLDFSLLNGNSVFNWASLERPLERILSTYGVELNIKECPRGEKTVKSAMVKGGSIGKILMLRRPHHENKQLKIKLEVDTQPPSHAVCEQKLLTFPFSTYVQCHDLGSCFSGKVHALLCRSYLKGRDWYDLVWYANRRFVPNLKMLESALALNGPWKGQQLTVTTDWIFSALREKVHSMDWKSIGKDVERFLDERGQHNLKLWSDDYFQQVLERIEQRVASV